MTADKLQCRYSIIRFMPHIETGEFANIGVILVAPRLGFLDFRIETRRHARVTNFFDTLDSQIFRSSVASLVQELERVRKMLPKPNANQSRIDFGKADPSAQLFVEITRQREGIINFSSERVVLSDDPSSTLDDLFGYYVERNFVTPRYRETVLEERMKDWLNEIHIGTRFVRRQFDDGIYKASFPFVEVDQAGDPQKIIKPFFLGQQEPTSIIDHGVKWKTSVSRLRRAGLLPDRVLFAVEGPTAGQAHIAAFNETVEALKDTNIDVIPFEKQSAILEYAAT